MVFMNSNWKRLFKDYILERGYDYYCSEMIEDFDVCNNTISVVVNGTDNYFVEIKFIRKSCMMLKQANMKMQLLF